MFRPNPWSHYGGGCLTPHGVATGGNQIAAQYPCDDAYEGPSGRVTAEYRSTPAAHFRMPEVLDRPDELRALPGIQYMGTRPIPNPLSTWHKVLLGTLIVGGTIGVGVLLFARPARAASAPVPTEDVAVDTAIEQLGSDADTSTIAQVAYAMAYPEGPLPPSGDYAPVWDRIVDTVQGRLGRGDAPVEVPTQPVDIDDTSERVAAWLAGLDPTQREEARDALEPPLWDPLVSAADARDDLSTRAALNNIKTAIEQLVEESKLSALSLYSSLDSSLGEDKLAEFRSIMEDTAGPLEFNPAERPWWRPGVA